MVLKIIILEINTELFMKWCNTQDVLKNDVVRETKLCLPVRKESIYKISQPRGDNYGNQVMGFSVSVYV